MVSVIQTIFHHVKRVSGIVFNDEVHKHGADESSGHHVDTVGGFEDGAAFVLFSDFDGVKEGHGYHADLKELDYDGVGPDFGLLFG